jgi:hypothetical protein
MTGQEAAQILQRPIFGNQVCIDAIKVMQMAEDLLHARKWAKRKELFTPVMRVEDPARIEHEDIETELDYWRNCGWRSEQ